MKKQQQEDDHLLVVDPHTGECVERHPEYNKMSLKPGIGANFLDKWKSDVFPNDYVVVNGHKAKPPRYYFKRLQQQDPVLFEQVEQSRAMRYESCEDNTEERLGARQRVLQAKLKKLERNL